ncbi:MAG TPA: glycosyltransferase family 2 protein [Anaerolineales bacterium]|nr:glycosyltransferase family 2 protein [Anaerolineales bacterium]
MNLLTIVIPAYNEESGIAEIIERVLAVRPALEGVGVGMELVVVDDGSRDRTGDIVGGYKGVRLVRHPVNKGYGAALKTGFAAGTGDLVGFLDADGTYPPENFPALCEQALNGADLVVGSRRSGADTHMPLVRKIGNFIWSNLITLLGGARVIDPASGMRVFRREILEKLYPLPDGLNLTPIMSTRAIHEGVRLVEVPIPYAERVGRSKLSVVRDGSLFLYSIVWTVLTYNPVRPLGFLGLVGTGLGALVAVWLVVTRLSGVTTLTPWGVAALFGGAVAGTAGINLFALGITFNYLVSLFVGQPIRQGLFGKPVFKTPLDRQFGWIGMVSVLAGFAVGVLALVVGTGAWEQSRLWLYLLGSGILILVGIQLVVYWVLLRVLDELSQRERLVQEDLGQ